MMSVNKAITRLANKKQMDTESCTYFFLFNVRLALRVESILRLRNYPKSVTGGS